MLYPFFRNLYDDKFKVETTGIEFFWHEIAAILRNSKAGRMQIDTHSFRGEIELLKEFFDTPIEAVHAFYTSAIPIF